MTKLPLIPPLLLFRAIRQELLRYKRVSEKTTVLLFDTGIWPISSYQHRHLISTLFANVDSVINDDHCPILRKDPHESAVRVHRQHLSLTDGRTHVPTVLS